MPDDRVDLPEAERSGGQRGEGPRDERPVGLERGSRAFDPDSLTRSGRCELERVFRRQDRRVGAAGEPRGEAELIDEGVDLLGGLVDHPDEAGLALGKLACANESLREPTDRCERRA